MTSRKRSPAEPGLEKGECFMSLGLRLFTEEFGRADGPECSAFLAAFEAGLVILGGYFSNDNGSAEFWQPIIRNTICRLAARLPPQT